MIIKKKKNKYIVDPEPLMSAGQILVLTVLIFLANIILLSIINSFMDNIWVSLIIQISVLLIPVIIIAMHYRYPMRDIFRVKNMLRIDLNLIIIFSTIFIVIISTRLSQFLQQYLPLSGFQIGWKQGLTEIDGGMTFVPYFIMSVIIMAFCEELLFRGVIQPSLIKRCGSKTGILITAILFAVFHLSLNDFVSLIMLGLFLGVLAFRGGTFIYAALAHVIFKGIAVSGTVLNQTGGVGFQEGGISIPIIITVTILFIVLMIMLFRLTDKRVIGEPDMYYI